MARPAGFEPATYGFEVRRSIQLSYGRVLHILIDSCHVIQAGSLSVCETFCELLLAEDLG